MRYISDDIPDDSCKLHLEARYYLSIFPKDAKENHEKFSQDSQSPALDLNPKPPE